MDWFLLVAGPIMFAPVFPIRNQSHFLQNSRSKITSTLCSVLGVDPPNPRLDFCLAFPHRSVTLFRPASGITGYGVFDIVFTGAKFYTDLLSVRGRCEYYSLIASD